MSRPMSSSEANRFKFLRQVVLPLWFLLAPCGSLLGVFDSGHRPPLALGAMAALPVVAFAIWYRKSDEFRQFTLGADLRILTIAQTWRIGGVVFLILHTQGILPGVFALPAGWGDIAVGATAPFVAWAISTPRGLPKLVFVTWNLLGTLDLIIAVSLGILASASPLGILAGEATTELMGKFPLSMIPTFFVPLLIIFHLIALGRAAQGGSLAVSSAS